jgi:hypothetical protein
MKSKKEDYTDYKSPTINCKHCNDVLNITPISRDTLLQRGPYNATYLYRCDCSKTEIQVLHIDKYPKVGTGHVH